MIDDFFEGANDGCGAIAGIGLAVAFGLLLGQMLASPIFWLASGAALLAWALHAAFAPRGRDAPEPHHGSHLAYMRSVAATARAAPSAPLPEHREDPVLERTLVPVALEFAPHEPSVFHPGEGGVPYRGQEQAKRRIDTAIAEMREDRGLRLLLAGRPRTGRGTLARITAARIQAARRRRGIAPGAYYVLPAHAFITATHLEAFAARLGPRDIVYVEEVNFLVRFGGAKPLLALLRSGEHRAPDGVCWIASSSRPDAIGTRGGPLRRAFDLEIALEDPTPDVIAEILRDQATPIHPDAAYEIAERTAPRPGRALRLYAQARELALAEASPLVTPGHVRDAIELLEIGR